MGGRAGHPPSAARTDPIRVVGGSGLFGELVGVLGGDEGVGLGEIAGDVGAPGGSSGGDLVGETEVLGEWADEPVAGRGDAGAQVALGAQALDGGGGGVPTGGDGPGDEDGVEAGGDRLGAAVDPAVARAGPPALVPGILGRRVPVVVPATDAESLAHAVLDEGILGVEQPARVPLLCRPLRHFESTDHWVRSVLCASVASLT